MKHLILTFLTLTTFALQADSLHQRPPTAPGVLYTPWRNSYNLTTTTKPLPSTQNECPFCRQLEENNDEKYHIIRRFSHHVVMLNAYPYNGGHLLIYPLEHKAHLEDMIPAARAELMDLVMHATRIVREALGAHGVNIGMNVGKAAGASIPTHLHFHILPRWEGYTGFIEFFGGAKVFAVNLHDLYALLKPHFDAIA